MLLILIYLNIPLVSRIYHCLWYHFLSSDIVLIFSAFLKYWLVMASKVGKVRYKIKAFRYKIGKSSKKGEAIEVWHGWVIQPQKIKFVTNCSGQDFITWSLRPDDPFMNIKCVLVPKTSLWQAILCQNWPNSAKNSSSFCFQTHSKVWLGTICIIDLRWMKSSKWSDRDWFSTPKHY
jgi:hypothetical protein